MSVGEDAPRPGLPRRLWRRVKRLVRAWRLLSCGELESLAGRVDGLAEDVDQRLAEQARGAERSAAEAAAQVREALESELVRQLQQDEELAQQIDAGLADHAAHTRRVEQIVERLEAELPRKARESHEAIEKLEGELGRRAVQIDQLQSHLEQRVAQVDELERQLAQRANRIEQIERQLAQAKQANEKLDARLSNRVEKDKQRLEQRLSQQAERARERHDKLNARVTQHADQHKRVKEKLETRLSEQADQLKQLKSELHQQIKQQAPALKDATSARKKVESLGRDLKKLKQESTELRDEVTQLSLEVEPLMRLSFEEDPWLKENRDVHRGERCFLLGCGPSLNEVDLTQLAGSVIMGVNGTYLLDEIELTYFASVSHIFWRHHEEGLKQMRCRRRFLPHYLRMLESDCPTSWLNFVDRRQYQRFEIGHPAGFSHEPHRQVFGGGTVIYPCLQILYHLGFEEVVLLGLDHDYGIDPATVGETGRHVAAEGLRAHFREDYYEAHGRVHIDLHTMERAYAIAREQFEADGRRIINASPGTKLEVFDKAAFETVIA